MNRKKFIRMICISAGAGAAFHCTACSKSSITPPPPQNIDFNIDLQAPANAALMNSGGFIEINGILVAHTNSGSFVAVQQNCTHENYPLIYEGANRRFFCTNHGATFLENGTVVTGPATINLRLYKTQLAGSQLRVYA